MEGVDLKAPFPEKQLVLLQHQSRNISVSFSDKMKSFLKQRGRSGHHLPSSAIICFAERAAFLICRTSGWVGDE